MIIIVLETQDTTPEAKVLIDLNYYIFIVLVVILPALHQIPMLGIHAAKLRDTYQKMTQSKIR